MTYPVNPKNVIVAGTPGAWLNIIAKFLAERGWLILWEKQDIEVRDGVLFFQHNSQNIEVKRIQDDLCAQHGCTPMSINLPKFYDIPYPGPEEFIQQFKGEPVVISGIFLAPFLDIWVPTSNVVIDIQATKEEDLQGLNRLTQGSFDSAYLKNIRVQHIERYTEHLKLFTSVFTMTNAEVKDGRTDRLASFLNSAF